MSRVCVNHNLLGPNMNNSPQFIPNITLQTKLLHIKRVLSDVSMKQRPFDSSRFSRKLTVGDSMLIHFAFRPVFAENPIQVTHQILPQYTQGDSEVTLVYKRWNCTWMCLSQTYYCHYYYKYEGLEECYLLPLKLQNVSRWNLKLI